MHVQKKTKIAALTVVPLALFCGNCFAEASPASDSDSFNDWLTQGNISGELKTMTFFKEFSGTLPNKRTSSAGGDIQYRSPQAAGFSVGLGVYGAYNFGLNNDDPEKTEIYLPSEDVTVLGKAFLRYQGYGFDLQGGRIGLDTPFANEGEGWTMIPALYEGFGGSYALNDTGDFRLNAYRIYRFKPESSDEFGKGDAGAPEIEDTSMPSVDSNGFTTVGLRYGQQWNTLAEAWYYNFDKRAQLGYGGVQLPVSALKFGNWTPYWGAQYLHEWDASDQAYPYHNIDTDLYSGRIGMKTRNHDLYFAATYVPRKEDAFLSGGFFAPYSYGIYDHTPLESGQPLVSMVTTNQPGKAFALRYAYHDEKYLGVFGLTRLELEDSSGIYYPLPAENINAAFMILGYNVTPRLHLEFEFDYVHSPNEVTGNYHAERLRLVYRFGAKMADDDY
ncbi:hypothetical protein PUG81_03860 [Erwiniaceae bacterium L1_54_6]|jgi:hypothetical protein|uniref:Porin n=1 Tax=Pantoea cypripedii TaxID=55209 RepID=A0A6B9FYM5_PANCY|nr:hypothetical protein [Pantoea cypripedii]MDF7658092.1 hypothetical protein [Erwiniaceae bacterium L1_54_6]QGY29138.1 hypothetical protein CUN67_09440 [Pantoea cypripedii]